MKKYKVYDVWMAFKLANKNFFGWMAVVWFPVYVSLIYGDGANDSEPLDDVVSMYFVSAILISFIVFIQSIIIYLANNKYVVDVDSGLFTFPRSDMENSFLAIVLLFPYWNLMRRRTVKCSDIENFYLDTQRWSEDTQVSNGTTSKGVSKSKTKKIQHVRYTLNVVGTFGSANLTFLSRQKRDEVRNAIAQCVKNKTGRSIDRKVAEFS